MKPTPVQLAVLRRARDLAGGVTLLARRIRVGANPLDAMLHGHASIPDSVFLRALDFLNEAEASGAIPEGFPPDWREMASKHRERD